MKALRIHCNVISDVMMMTSEAYCLVHAKTLGQMAILLLVDYASSLMNGFL